MNPELFLEQKDAAPLTLALNQWANRVSVASDRQDVLESAGIDTALLNIKLDTKPNQFATALIAAFRNYSIKSERLDYHPLVSLLGYLRDLAPIYGLADSDAALFDRLVKHGQENLKALTARSAVGRIESPKETGIGTGVLVQKNLLLTCYHVFTKSRADKAWVRFNYKPGSYMLENYLFELDLDFVSYHNRPDYALLRVKGVPQQLTATPIDAILDSGQEIRLIHHPQGKPVEISGLGQITQVGEDYIDHNVTTDEGSSGAPIFNRQWELVAIHQGHPGIGRPVVPGTMGGIPIRAIWNQISPHLA